VGLTAFQYCELAVTYVLFKISKKVQHIKISIKHLESVSYLNGYIYINVIVSYSTYIIYFVMLGCSVNLIFHM